MNGALQQKGASLNGCPTLLLAPHRTTLQVRNGTCGHFKPQGDAEEVCDPKVQVQWF